MPGPQKITFGDMRESGVRGVLIYCSDYRCSHHIAVTAEQWGDDVRLSDLEPKFICSACGKRGAVGPDLFRAACDMGLEGLVSKRRDRPYQSGRSKFWLKVKNRKHPAMNRVVEAFA